ncbi:hypothetical protein RSAG8_08815, partial [Rhizoctonia solani AG-8 WAC10335]
PVAREYTPLTAYTRRTSATLTLCRILASSQLETSREFLYTPHDSSKPLYHGTSTDLSSASNMANSHSPTGLSPDGLTSRDLPISATRWHPYCVTERVLSREGRRRAAKASTYSPFHEFAFLTNDTPAIEYH